MKQLLKKLYTSIPYKRLAYQFLKKIYVPNEEIYKHLHFSESFRINIAPNTTLKLYNFTRIENEIFWEGITGKWEKESIKLWIQLSEISNTVFDVGANTGVYSLISQSVNHKSKVYAFEPHPHFFKLLEKHKKLNQFQNMYCINQAASNRIGEIEIEDYSESGKSIHVESNTLDNFCLQQNLESVDLIKIDVETFEPQVIEGFQTIINKYKPTFLIEILSAKAAEDLNHYFLNQDYLFFNIDEEAGIRQTLKLEKSDSFNYLICNRNIAKSLSIQFSNFIKS